MTKVIFPEISIRIPTDEEVKQNTLPSWKAVEPVLLSRLHPAIMRLSIPTHFVEIPTTEIIANWLPAFDAAPDGEVAVKRLLDEGRASLANFPDGFFFKLDSRSPKDTEINRWTAENLNDLPGAFFSSVRMLDDLCAHRFHRETFVLCFRQWTELHDEQRVFVRDRKIQGITRYDYFEPTPEYYNARFIDGVSADAAQLFAAIEPYMDIDDYVFDFAYQSDGKTILIELNPYGLSDPCCFKTYANILGYKAETTPP